MRLHIRPFRSFWLIGSIALLVIGCGSVSVTKQSGNAAPAVPTPPPSKFFTPTISTAPGTGFAWQPLLETPTTALAFAPSDDNVGYGCAQAGNTAVMVVWATHDRGAHFAQTTAVPAVPGG